MEAEPINPGPPEWVPPLTVAGLSPQDPYYPWGKLHDVWFDEFRIELQLQAADLE